MAEKWSIGPTGAQQVSFRIPKEELLNLDELNMLAFRTLPCLAACTYEKQGKKSYLNYMANRAASVAAVAKVIHPEQFLQLLEALAYLLSLTDSGKLRLQNIVAEPEYVFFGPRYIEFLYLPLEKQKATTQKKLLTAILKKCKGPVAEAFLPRLKAAGEFGLVPLLYAYVEQARRPQVQPPVAPPPQAPAEEEGATTVLSRQPVPEEPIHTQNPVSWQIPSQPVIEEVPAVQSPMNWQIPAQPEAAEEEGATTVLSRQPAAEEPIHTQNPVSWQIPAQSAPAEEEGETTVLSRHPVVEELPPVRNPLSWQIPSQGRNTWQPPVQPVPEPEYEETTVLSRQAPIPAAPPKGGPKRRGSYLLRCNTGEKIPFLDDHLVLGKDSANGSYRIANNNSISGRHAAIVYENGNWYLMDMFSTNGSFIEGVRVQPGMKTELYSGVMISLGTEVFQVFLEE